MKPGDTVTRYLAGDVVMMEGLKVVHVDDKLIYCGYPYMPEKCISCGKGVDRFAARPWCPDPCNTDLRDSNNRLPTTPGEYQGWLFDKTFGYEVDFELGWGVPGPDGEIVTGSYIKAQDG